MRVCLCACVICKGILWIYGVSACVSACIPSLVWLDLCVFVYVLGMRLLGGAVGEVLELLLVDLSDNGLVRGRQHGVLLGEILVEVIHISFGLLQTHAHENTHTKAQTEGRMSENVQNYMTATPSDHCDLLFLERCSLRGSLINTPQTF